MDTVGTLEGWLKSLNLEQYLQTFQNAGYTSISHCTTLDDDLLIIIGITPLGHRKRILEHLPLVNNGNGDSSPQTPKSDTEFCDTSPRNTSLDSSLSKDENSNRPRPIPKPRKTKRITKTVESEILRPVPAPRTNSSGSKNGSFVIKGVTIDESTDEVDSSHVQKTKGDISTVSFLSDSTNQNSDHVKLEGNSISFPKQVADIRGESHRKDLDISDTVPPPIFPKDKTLSNPAYCAEVDISDENIYEGIWVCSSYSNTQNVSVTQNDKQISSPAVKETNIDDDSEDYDVPPALPRKVGSKSYEKDIHRETNIDEVTSGSNVERESPSNLLAKKSAANESSFKQTNLGEVLANETSNSWTSRHLNENSDFKMRNESRNRVTSNLIQFSPDRSSNLFSFDRSSQSADIKIPERLIKQPDIKEELEPNSERSKDLSFEQENVETLDSDYANFSGKYPETSKGNFEISDEDFEAMFRQSSTGTDEPVQTLDNLSMSEKDVRKSFDMPPPVFPPPPLPSDQKSDSMSNLNDDDLIAVFDPLKCEPSPSLPPVPPRQGSVSSTTTDTTYVNLNTSKPDTESQTNQGKSNSAIYSVAGASAKDGFKFPDTSFNTSCDPFHGDDPFSEFATECEQFNQGGLGSLNTGFEDDSPGYQDFDPFGLNREDSGIRSHPETPNLNDVPPPPHWNESIHDPGSLYAMAKGMQLDGASTDDSSDLDSEDPLDSSPEVINAGSEIVSNVQSPRSKERSGYLYKQGGLKGNKGWRKRWVIFNGRDLRYYASAKTQVSKRIVPLSCMKKVEVNVKGTDTSRFKFQLVTNNRIFLFAAETLDDCTMWSSTLMEAILSYKEPPGGEEEGGDMCDPDKQGYVKFERKKDKYYVAIKQGKLCYYNTEQDYKQASPIHEIEMKLASVKEVGKNKLQMSTHYAYFILVFDSYHDCLLWRMAIEEAIADGLGDNRVLNEVQKNPSNMNCADCDTKDPHWASINLGIVLCKKCAGIHRHFDVRLSRVKSLRMDTAIWTPSLIEMMKAIGNDNAKKFWEGTLRDSRITDSTPPSIRKQFLENKYKQKAFCNSHPFTGNQKELNEELLRAAETDDLFLTIQLVFSGANVLYTRTTGAEEESAFQIAKRAGHRLQMEFLYQNGGDKYSRGYADSDEALAIRLRSDVCLEGYLMKTGSNMKDFLKRWCVLEHGCIRYFSNEKSSIAKDSIEHECIQCIHATPLDRYPYAFELSTIKKGNRCFLFAATSAEEKQTWFRAIAKLFCPVPLFEEIDQLEFSLAGNFFIREGLTSEWRRTWLMINNKVVSYTDKDIRLSEQVDLRKVTNLKYQDAVSACTECVESGRCFAVDVPGKALYFQANLERDTVKLFTELEKRMKSGGESLEDQQLTSEDIPVIVDKCIKFIDDHGLREKGIYREAAVNSKVQNILTKLTSDAYSLVLQPEHHMIHEVANVLKRFFRNLKEPLLSSQLYSQWIQHAGNADHDTKLKWYKYLLSQLPLVNRLTLKLLAVHLSRIQTYHSENLMTVENIAIAFGSTLMRASWEDQLAQGQSKIPMEMKVIGDIITYHEWLFDIESKDREIEKQIEEAKRKIESIQKNNMERQSMVRQGPLLISIYYLDYRGQSEIQQVTDTTDVKGAVSLIKKRLGIKTGTWSLHEIVCKGMIERPLHPNDNIYNIVMAWAGWEEAYRSSVCLCLKPDDLIQKIDNAYEFGRPLFADLKYSDKKSFKKFTFEFKQSRLAYSKDMKSAGTPINCWNIEDLNVYVGADPKRTCPTRYSFSFVVKTERIGKDTPYFGRTVCCNSEEELMSWVAAMMVAQHPEGLLS